MRSKLPVLAGFGLALSVSLGGCNSSEPPSVPPTEDTSEAETTPVENVTITADTPAAAVAGGEDGNAMQSPVAGVAKDFIRGKGGLEEKCKAAVAKEGLAVIGTNRIEESEAAIEIYVNVEGANAPWKCLGYTDGTIGDVQFTGDEGAA